MTLGAVKPDLVEFLRSPNILTSKPSLFGYGNYKHKLVIESVQKVRFLERGK